MTGLSVVLRGAISYREISHNTFLIPAGVTGCMGLIYSTLRAWEERRRWVLSGRSNGRWEPRVASGLVAFNTFLGGGRSFEPPIFCGKPGEKRV